MNDPEQNSFYMEISEYITLIVEIGIRDSEDIVEWDARPIIAA